MRRWGEEDEKEVGRGGGSIREETNNAPSFRHSNTLSPLFSSPSLPLLGRYADHSLSGRVVERVVEGGPRPFGMRGGGEMR